MVVAWTMRLRAPAAERRRSIRRFSSSRQWLVERLELRALCAADLHITSVAAHGNGIVVNYDITDADASAFDVALYASPDGTTLGTLLQSQRVSSSSDLSRGTGHAVTIAPDFADIEGDYYLVAVLDSSGELSESSEANNRQTLASGVFRTASGIVHVHGSDNADTLSLSQGTSVGVTLNGNTTSWTASSVAAIHARLHGGNDNQYLSTSVSVPLRIWGGAGSDALTGGDAHDQLFGGAGNDTLLGGAGNDTLSGGAGDDWLYGDHGQVWGNSVAQGGDDDVWGDDGNDWLFGEGGADLVDGGAGNDYAYGGYGDDHVHSGASSGTEYIFGEAGNDHLYLESATASYYDSNGSNTIHAYQQPTGPQWSHSGTTLTVTGTSGADTITLATEYYSGSLWLTMNGVRIAATSAVSTFAVYGGAGDDTLNASALASAGIQSLSLYGGAGNDTLIGSDGYGGEALYGEEGNDYLWGYGGNDTLNGGYGGDYLYGGEGADTLAGGDGNDVLNGGVGNDTFLGADADSIADRPTISNYSVTRSENGWWQFQGRVLDDDNPQGRTVNIQGAFSANGLVDANGWFDIMLHRPDIPSGWFSATYTDQESLTSSAVWDSP